MEGGCDDPAEKNWPPLSLLVFSLFFLSRLLMLWCSARCLLLPCLVLGWILASLPTRARCSSGFQGTARGFEGGCGTGSRAGRWVSMSSSGYGRAGRWLSPGCHSLTSLPRVSPAAGKPEERSERDTRLKTRRDGATGVRRRVSGNRPRTDLDRRGSDGDSDRRNQDTTRHTRPDGTVHRTWMEA